MPFQATYPPDAPARADIDALDGPTLLEFGTPWCGWCRGAQSLIAAALEGHPRVRHLKVEDGSGRTLGRSFGVTLWPTLILLVDGSEVQRWVRPQGRAELDLALARIDPAGAL